MLVYSTNFKSVSHLTNPQLSLASSSMLSGAISTHGTASKSSTTAKAKDQKQQQIDALKFQNARLEETITTLKKQATEDCQRREMTLHELNKKHYEKVAEVMQLRNLLAPAERNKRGYVLYSIPPP